MDKLESLLDRLEKVTGYLESVTQKDNMNRPNSHNTSNGLVPSSASLTDYDKLINGPVAEFSTLSSKIGGDVEEHCKLLLNCFRSQRRFLELTLIHSKPSAEELEKMTKSCFDSITTVENFRDKKRSSSQFNQISAVSESVMALKWIVVTPSPASFIKNMQEAAEFFTNRVIKDHKDSDPTHVSWARTLISVWTQLMDYVKQHYPTGLTWNANGTPAVATNSPRIPPPPPPKPVKLDQASAKGDPNTVGALFADLNRGEAVTAGLRKVTDDMKTHKNPNLRAQPGLEPGAKKEVAKPDVKPAAPKQQASVLELKGNKWIVENFQNQELHITDTKPKHAIYVYKCKTCTLEVKGKVNSIMLDDCKKTGVVFDDVISSLDVVNCQNVQVQALGQLQTVNVDKTDSCQIYLSSTSLNAEIITSKSSAINVLIPKADGEFDEYPVPEQFKTVFTGKGLETTHHKGI